MKKLLSLCIIVAFAAPLYAQEPTAVEREYLAYRREKTLPSYGLTKIQGLISQLQRVEGQTKLDDGQYNALTVKEKFTYAMIHGEVHHQICFAMPEARDAYKHISSYFPIVFDGQRTWSERQRNFLTKDRKEVVSLLEATIKSNKRVGANLKKDHLDLKGLELIPLLVETYSRDKKDHDILTLLMRLMVNGKYKDFMESEVYETLFENLDRRWYGESKSSYRTFIEASPKNQRWIQETATAYYKSIKKK